MLTGLLRLGRWYYALPMALTFLLTVEYARGGALPGFWGTDLAATGALALVIAAAYVLNDVFDVAVDQANAAPRPIAQDRVPRSLAAVFSLLLAAAGLTLGLTAGSRLFGWALLLLSAGLAGYDAFSKRMGLLKPAVAAVLMTAIYPLAYAQAGGAIGSRAATLPAFAAWMFISAWAYGILKDLRDRKGDPQNRLHGPLARCPRAWFRVADGLVVLGGLILLLPLGLGSRWVYGVLVIPLAGGAIARMLLERNLPRKLKWIYAEFVAVGLATTADVLCLGF